MSNVSSANGALAARQSARPVAGPSGSASQIPTGTTQGQNNVYPMEVVRIRERARSVDLHNVFGCVTRSAEVFLKTYGKSPDEEYHYRERNNAGCAMCRDSFFPKGSEQTNMVKLLQQKSQENPGDDVLRYVFHNRHSSCDPRQIRAYLYRLKENNYAGLREFARILTPSSNKKGDLIPIYQAHLKSRVRSLYRNAGEVGSTDSFMLLFAEMVWAACSSVPSLGTLGRVHWGIVFEPVDEQGRIAFKAEPTLGTRLACVGENFCLSATMAFFLFYIAALRPVLQRIDNSFASGFWGFFRGFYGPSPRLETYEKDGDRLDKHLLSEEVIQDITPATTTTFTERDQKHLSGILRQGVRELRANTIGANQSISTSNPNDAIGLLDKAFDRAREKWEAYVREYRDVRGSSQIKEIKSVEQRERFYQIRDLVNEACDMMLLKEETSSSAKPSAQQGR